MTRSARADDHEGAAEDENQADPPKELGRSSWGTIQALREVGWPTWMNRNTWKWPQFMTLSGPQLAIEAAGLKCVFLPLSIKF